MLAFVRPAAPHSMLVLSISSACEVQDLSYICQNFFIVTMPKFIVGYSYPISTSFLTDCASPKLGRSTVCQSHAATQHVTFITAVHLPHLTDLTACNALHRFGSMRRQGQVKIPTSTCTTTSCCRHSLCPWRGWIVGPPAMRSLGTWQLWAP